MDESMSARGSGRLVLVGSGDEPTPLLSDIPGHLERAAKLLCDGTHRMPRTLFLVASYDDGSVTLRGFGEPANVFELKGVLAAASQLHHIDDGDL